MIAYEELAAALERWRVRNGMPATPPLFTGPRPTTTAAYTATAAAPAPAYVAPAPAPAYAAPAPQPIASPRTAPPSAPPGGNRQTLFGVAPPPAVAYAAAAAATPTPIDTMDESVDDLVDSDVVEDAQDVYDNEGEDFAMSFGARTGGATTMSDDDEREATQIGATPPPVEVPSAAPARWRDPAEDDDLP